MAGGKIILLKNTLKNEMICCYILAVVLFSMVSSLSAKSIDISASISSDQIIYENTFNLSVSISNTGEETVHQIEGYFFLPEGFSSNDEINIEKLEPNFSFRENFFVFINETNLPGVYPIVMLLKYCNEKLLNFSKMYSYLLAYKTDYNSKVEGYIRYLEIGEGETRETHLIIRNYDDKPHDITVNLFLPEELESSFSEETVTVDTMSIQEIKIPITANNVKTENDCIAIAALEYEYNSIHYSTFAYGTIRTVRGKEIPLIVWILLLIFISLFIFYIYVKIKERK